MLKEPYKTTKNQKSEPIFWVRFVSDGEGWQPPIHHSGMTSEMIKSGRYTPLYIHPIPTDHSPDARNMITQRQEPAAWRITAKRFCGDFTKDRDIAQYWLEKEPESITPLYLAPTLPLEPSDELIAEIKAMADIRLIDGRVELSNVKEIIHAIVHHPIYAN